MTPFFIENLEICENSSFLNINQIDIKIFGFLKFSKNVFSLIRFFAK